jgi:hypothetical protein
LDTATYLKLIVRTDSESEDGTASGSPPREFLKLDVKRIADGTPCLTRVKSTLRDRGLLHVKDHVEKAIEREKVQRVASEFQVLYRSCRLAEVPSSGLQAKDPTATASADEHVCGGSAPSFKSQLISVSHSFLTSVLWALPRRPFAVIEPTLALGMGGTLKDGSEVLRAESMSFMERSGELLFEKEVEAHAIEPLATILDLCKTIHQTEGTWWSRNLSCMCLYIMGSRVIQTDDPTHPLARADSNLTLLECSNGKMLLCIPAAMNAPGLGAADFCDTSSDARNVAIPARLTPPLTRVYDAVESMGVACGLYHLRYQLWLDCEFVTLPFSDVTVPLFIAEYDAKVFDAKTLRTLQGLRKSAVKAA